MLCYMLINTVGKKFISIRGRGCSKIFTQIFNENNASKSLMAHLVAFLKPISCRREVKECLIGAGLSQGA